MGKVILITSGKGGVGKTTVTANLGFALALRNKKVVVVEGDIGLNNLDVALQIEDKILYDAGDVVSGKARLNQALVEINENFFALSASTAASNFIKAKDFAEIISQLSNAFDYVLIDSPAGIEESFHRAASGATESIIVTTPHISSIRDAFKASKILAGYAISPVGLIVNRIKGEQVVNKTSIGASEIAATIKLPLYGVIPEDDSINLSGIAALNKKSSAYYSYNLIAEYIDGGEKRIYDCVAEHRGMLSRIKRLLTQ